MAEKNNEDLDLIKKLLSDKLDKKGRKNLYHLDLIRKQMRKQWYENRHNPIDGNIGNRIWSKIENRRKKVHKILVPSELWYIAAFISIILVIGGLWTHSNTDKTIVEEYVEVEAQESRTYLLPDSSKVWMQEGSSIRFAKRFKEHRDVWLEGNSLFEVHKNPGRKFRVHLDHAFIEVKGTCFLVEQYNSGRNEITLFKGSINFNIKSNPDKIKMKPQQRLIYNPADASIRIQEIENLNWKNGRYYFTRFNLEHLVRIMNQMYDENPHIRIDSGVNKNCAFTGSIGFDESLEDVIDKICFTLNLQSKKIGDEISIHN